MKDNWTDERQKSADKSNSVAKQAVMKLPDFLLANVIVTPEQHGRLTDILNAKSIFSSGYDVKFDEPVKGGASGIVAEVKSNYPCEDRGFGQNQKDGIKRDLDRMTGMRPAKEEADISDCYKFFAMLDDGCGKVREALEKFITSYNKTLGAAGAKTSVVMWGSKPLNTTDVFVVLL